MSAGHNAAALGTAAVLAIGGTALYQPDSAPSVSIDSAEPIQQVVTAEDLKASNDVLADSILAQLNSKSTAVSTPTPTVATQIKQVQCPSPQVVTNTKVVKTPGKTVRYNRLVDPTPNPYVFAHNANYSALSDKFGDKYAASVMGKKIRRDTPIKNHLELLGASYKTIMDQQTDLNQQAQLIEQFKSDFAALQTQMATSPISPAQSYSEQVQKLRSQYQ